MISRSPDTIVRVQTDCAGTISKIHWYVFIINNDVLVFSRYYWIYYYYYVIVINNNKWLNAQWHHLSSGNLRFAGFTRIMDEFHS